MLCGLFFKQKTAYELRISEWSSDVCSSDLTPQVIHLKDYTPPAFLIDSVARDIDMRDDHTLVIATLAVRRNSASNEANAPLRLDELGKASGRKQVCQNVQI